MFSANYKFQIIILLCADMHVITTLVLKTILKQILLPKNLENRKTMTLLNQQYNSKG